MSSFVKYRVKEVAADFGMTSKEISAILEKYFVKPKSPAQVLEEDQLNVIFDYLTQQNQISSIEVVFAAAFAAREAEEKRKAEEAAKKAAEEKKKAEEAAKSTGKPAPAASGKPEEKKPGQSGQPAKSGEKKPSEPQRKRERRVVDTSAVQVNADRFDDRVDTLISERDQNRSGGKQKIGGKNKKQQGPKGAKSKEDERKRLSRLRLEAIKKTRSPSRSPTRSPWASWPPG